MSTIKELCRKYELPLNVTYPDLKDCYYHDYFTINNINYIEDMVDGVWPDGTPMRWNISLNYDHWSVYGQIQGNDKQKEDKVKKPSHYNQGGIQPIEYIKANNMNFIEGNIIKYTSRYKYKNGLEDLKKARFYLDMLIEDLEDGEKENP